MTPKQQPTQEPLFDAGWCQRWRTRKCSWRHVSEGGFDKFHYRVEPVKEGPARGFVEHHHYSRSWPSAKVRYGLFEGHHLVGVAVLGLPMNYAALTGPFPTLAPSDESVDLSRLVLLDEVPANAESWFVSQVFRDAWRHKGLRGVIAFSDPAPRHTADGRVIMPGHVGTVYQALNAVYLGRNRTRWLTVLPDGTVFSDRTLQKVVGEERGAAGVIERLVALGAPPKPQRQPGAQWLPEALAAVGARKQRFPGKHKYAWAIGDRASRRATPVALPSQPYPKPHELVGVAA